MKFVLFKDARFSRDDYEELVCRVMDSIDLLSKWESDLPDSDSLSSAEQDHMQNFHKGITIIVCCGFTI